MRRITSLIITPATLPLVNALGGTSRAWTIVYAIFAAAAAILFSYIPLFFGMETVSLLVISSVIRGIGYALVIGVQFAIIGDAVAYGEWKTGVRSEGLVFSAQSFGCKVGMGLGNALIGALLSWSHYDGDLTVQPDSAITVIKVLYVAMPVLVAILQLLLMIPYTAEKEYDIMNKELAERRALNAGKD